MERLLPAADRERIRPWGGLEVRLSGRWRYSWQEMGWADNGEAGLLLPAGSHLDLERGLELSRGPWWGAISLRGQGRLGDGPGGEPVERAFLYQRWPLPTGPVADGRARQRGGDWAWDVPRAVLGYQAANWSLVAGRMPARTGPGLSGALVLDRQAPALPAVTIRRTTPFAWHGIMEPLAPSAFLVRVGRLDEREVLYEDETGHRSLEAEPWFFQWLVGWRPLKFFRATFTQTAVATAREGTLWPDLLQINFPVIGTTWREADSGPITDRIFSAQFELLWGPAPIFPLPDGGGRAYWDYAGTDFLPSGPGGVIPEISIPASVVGVELVSARWDLNLEYFETYHPEALWYSNGGYPAGYTQDGWLLGHPVGGGAQGGLVGVTIRPGRGRAEVSLSGRFSRWEHEKFIPGEARRHSLGLRLGKNPEHSRDGRLWHVLMEWNREESRPENAPSADRDWWRAAISVSSY